MWYVSYENSPFGGEVYNNQFGAGTGQTRLKVSFVSDIRDRHCKSVNVVVWFYMLRLLATIVGWK